MNKKLIAILLAMALVLSLAACGGGESSGENTKPVISGVADQVITAGQEFNALAGVTAADKEDGDVTSLITIESSPALAFSGGKATPDKAGSYELVYSVTDKGGLVGEAYATLTVTKATGEPVLYKSFDFSKSYKADDHGWKASFGEAASGSAELKQGAYVFDVTNPGGGDGDVKLAKAGFTVKAADYKVKVWGKSTAPTYAHIMARDEKADGWSTFGGVYNVRFTEEISCQELNFTAPADGSVELLIHMGKITPNPENAADTTPDNFTVTIDKIEIYEISGEEHQVPVLEGQPALSVSAGDGASATADGSTVTIDGYPTEGGVWSIKADIALPGVTIESGVKYYYSYTVTATGAQSGECLVESATLFDQQRANFAGLSLDAGESKTVTNIFVAENNVADPVIRLQIGNPSDGVTTNTLTFSDLSFGTVEGDKEVKKTIDAFAPIGKNSANEGDADCPWMTFNGTDEDNERGVGTIWAEGGSLFYRIDNGGNVDWHNKLICGFDTNPLILASDAYYTVTFTVKATKPVSCGFFLNPAGGWDPRISEGVDITTEAQTFSFSTTDIFLTDMSFELLFQFGSDATAALGEVTIEFTDVQIMQMSVL